MTLTTQSADTDVRACLLHADYHVWGENCYQAGLCWALDRPRMSAERMRELYELAVEEKILLSTWRLQRR